MIAPATAVPAPIAALVAERGLPTMRQESWRFTNPAPIAAVGFGPSARASMEIRGTEALPAAAVLPELLRRLEADSIFAAANAALTPGAQLLRLSGDVAQPITITHHNDAAVAYPRLVIDIAAGARVRIIERFTGQGSYHSVLALTVAQGAQLEYVRVHQEGGQAVHCAALTAEIAAGATTAIHQFALGGRLLRTDMHAALAGESSEATFNALMLADADRLVDVHSTLEHRAPQCRSRQLYKSLLNDRSRAVFRGRIHVHSMAQQTDAVQSSRSLLLSDEAIINANPELEIYADDVKCTHGATIGALDEASLFYLRSRGIPVVEARRMLVAAFAAEMLDAVADATMRAQLEALVSARIADVVARAQAVI